MSVLEHRIPPPLVAMAAAGLMWLASRFGAPLAPDAEFKTGLAVLLAAAGVASSVSGMWAFTQARTTMDPMQLDTAAALVTRGIYRITRNPMYLGLTLVLLAWAVYLSDLFAFVFVPVFVWYITRFQIVPEERALSKQFGAAYDEYRGRVRRWI